MTHALAVALISRMIFNLREVGTEVYEGTEEWRSRVEKSTKLMEFRVPTDIDGYGHDYGASLDETHGEAESANANLP